MSDQEQAVAALRALLGPTQVISDARLLEYYKLDGLRPSRGYRDREQLGAQPTCVVRPRSTADVQALVRWANTQRVPLIPYGGGTGLMGGAMTSGEGVLLDFQDMARLLAISQEDHQAVVQPGVVLGTLEDALHARGLTLGHDPWTLGIATVGGAISTDGLGYRGGQYGSMGEQVLGLEVVLPNGMTLRTRAVPKSSTGPDLSQLFIGGEGVFGLVTEATLHVFPAPEGRALLAFAFPTFPTGFAAASEMTGVGLRPALLELDEDEPTSTLASTPGEGSQVVTLYLGCEGFRELVEAQRTRACAICQRHDGKDLGEPVAQAFWYGRHRTADRFQRERLNNLKRGVLDLRPPGSFDYIHVALPRSQVLPFRERALHLCRERGVTVTQCGIWTRPELFSMALRNESSHTEVLADTVDALLTMAQDVGGSMEYCHGIGVRLAHLLERELGAGLYLLRTLKQILDPGSVVNPGKLGLSPATPGWNPP
ncbi:MAG: FAD-binding oxidoreductase [Nitrospinae bacterium]|nr:FAD-binding oxidoreductase [Nitrospinota bacterium]